MQYLDLFPDPDKASCMSVWNRSFTASYLSDNAEWHHMAVTWTKADNGRMRIFKDGLMMSEVRPFFYPFLTIQPLRHSGNPLCTLATSNCHGPCTCLVCCRPGLSSVG